MATAARRRSASSPTRRRHSFLQMVIEEMERAAEDRDIRHRMRLRAYREARRAITRFIMDARKIFYARYKPWWRLLRRVAPTRAFVYIIPGLLVKHYMQTVGLKWAKPPGYIVLKRHSYCFSNKNMIKLSPNVFAITEWRVYDAIAVDNTLYVTPDPPAHAEDRDWILPLLELRKYEDVFVFVFDMGDANDPMDRVAIAWHARLRQRIYHIPAILYYYLHAIYTRIRLFFASGKPEQVDNSVHCSLYGFPRNRKPRRTSNTMHTWICLDKVCGLRFKIRDYRKKWTPGVEGDVDVGMAP